MTVTKKTNTRHIETSPLGIPEGIGMTVRTMYAGNTSPRFDESLIDAIGDKTPYLIMLNDELFSSDECKCFGNWSYT